MDGASSLLPHIFTCINKKAPITWTWWNIPATHPQIVFSGTNILVAKFWLAFFGCYCDLNNYVDVSYVHVHQWVGVCMPWPFLSHFIGQRMLTVYSSAPQGCVCNHVKAPPILSSVNPPAVKEDSVHSFMVAVSPSSRLPPPLPSVSFSRLAGTCIYVNMWMAWELWGEEGCGVRMSVTIVAIVNFWVCQEGVIPIDIGRKGLCLRRRSSLGSHNAIRTLRLRSWSLGECVWCTRVCNTPHHPCR